MGICNSKEKQPKNPQGYGPPGGNSQPSITSKSQSKGKGQKYDVATRSRFQGEFVHQGVRIPPPETSLEQLEVRLDRGAPPDLKTTTEKHYFQYLEKYDLKKLMPTTVGGGAAAAHVGGPDDDASPHHSTNLTNASIGEIQKPIKRAASVRGKTTDLQSAEKFQPNVENKEPAVLTQLIDVMLKWPTLAHLDDREIMALALATRARTFQPTHVIFSAGESVENPEMYFVMSGSISVQQAGGMDRVRSERVITAGGRFGENEVLAGGARSATAIAMTTAQCYALDEDHLRNMLTAGAHRKRERYVKWLEKITWLQSLERKKKIQLADALEARKYKPGEKIISYGHPGEWMYIIEEGVVHVWGYTDQHIPITDKPVCSFQAGDCVGELEFIAEETHDCVADVVAVTEVRTVRLNKKHFEMCLGPIVDILRENVNALEKFEYYRERMKRLKEEH